MDLNPCLQGFTLNGVPLLGGKKMLGSIAVWVLLLTSCSLQEMGVGKSYLGGGLDPNLNVDKFTLDNGLRLLVIENPQLPIFSYYTFYDVGGRHEGEGTTGATHFLEHMMFKGSKKYGPTLFDSNIEKRGGSTNAYTTFDSTVYYESLPREALGIIIDMEADRMENILLIPASVERERNVIFEERKMRYENSPRGKLHLAMMQNIFEGTPYGGSVIGEVADLKKLTPQNLRNFYNDFYRPNNTVIAIAGDVEASAVYRMIKEKMGHFRPSPKLAEFKSGKDNPDRFSHRARYKRDVSIHGSNPLPLFSLAFKSVGIGSRKGFILDLLSSIVGDGESSHLSQTFVKGPKPIMSMVGSFNYTLKHNGVFFISGQLTEKVTPSRAKRRLLGELKNVCTRAITERSVQKAKNRILVDYFNQIQTNSGAAEFIGFRETYFNNFNFYKTELEAYRTITMNEIKRECHDLFKDEQYVFLSVWNKHKRRSKQ